jgi:hypothetical protein
VSSARWPSRCGQRALRLGAHRLVTERTGSAPVLILDDVLSELDAQRATALLHHLPPGQVVLTTASPLPDAAHPDATVRIVAGTVDAPSDAPGVPGLRVPSGSRPDRGRPASAAATVDVDGD